MQSVTSLEPAPTVYLPCSLQANDERQKTQSDMEENDDNKITHRLAQSAGASAASHRVFATAERTHEQTANAGTHGSQSTHDAAETAPVTELNLPAFRASDRAQKRATNRECIECT